ncbi:MAG: hypothetical protein PHU71_04225 [Candidatus Gracilibacteria bacterium]|nr:hypothetical protein [Candidatus Gracilibacteria bacterium]
MFNKKKFSFSLHPRKNFLGTLLVVIGIVLIWRGIWDLADIYFLPEHPVLSNVIGIALGTLILYLPDNDVGELL